MDERMAWWSSAWTWIYILGLGGFAVVALALLPLGIRDLFRLMSDLNDGLSSEDVDD